VTTAPSVVGAAVDWPALLAGACAGEGMTGVYQPLVDLERGVVAGYEALIRFSQLPGVAPDAWFAAARRHGCEPELEAAALATTLAHRPDLPPDTFLSINVGPDTLASEPVAAQLDRLGDLRGIVIEMTEQTPIDSYGALAEHLDAYRDRGALVAIDDAGSGYAGLAHILELRPSILKLDRSLVSGIDGDEAKRALVEMLGLFANRIDAWILAEGIETASELRTLRRLDVPLGQGWVLGRPAAPWASVLPDAAAELREEASAPAGPADTDAVRAIMEPARWVPVGSPPVEVGQLPGIVDGHPYVVAVDDHRVPVGAVTPTSRLIGMLVPVTRLAASTTVADAARRALTRPVEHRFEPLVCTDAAGRLLGVVPFERLVDHLARRS
jgi:EAL domain-containing protein (putative c-di-GMP-specific phosphodiesterase class I)